MRIILFLLLVFLAGCSSTQPVQCSSDSDCVPKECCHPESCIASVDKPKSACSGTFCTEECRPGTLDCGQGSCRCIDGTCAAVIA